MLPMNNFQINLAQLLHTFTEYINLQSRYKDIYTKKKLLFFFFFDIITYI